jgi:hypothetical protein
MENASIALLRGIFEEAALIEFRISEPILLPSFLKDRQTDEMVECLQLCFAL